MDDWDRDDFVPPPPKIADSWEDEDEVQLPTAQKAALAAAQKEDKKEDKKEEKPKEVPKAQPAKGAKVPETEEEKKQKLADAAELYNSLGIFGPDFKEPKTAADFNQLAKTIAEKVPKLGVKNYNEFVKVLLGNLAKNMKPEDLKKVSLNLTNYSKEKAKEKPKVAEAPVQRKSTKQANVALGGFEENYASIQDDKADEFDFM